MKQKFDDIFDQILTEIQKGRSIEDCLREYPEFAQELEPLLQLGLAINALPKPEPSPDNVNRAIKKSLEMAITDRQERFSWKDIWLFKPQFVRAFGIILLVGVLGWVGVLVAARSMPGETLYPIKIFTEKIQYTLTFNKEGRAELHLVFSDRRSEELLKSFEQGGKLNEELVMEMLAEAHLALACTDSLAPEVCADFLKRLRLCNEKYTTILENLKPLVNESDTTIIIKALDQCKKCRDCIDQRLNDQPETSRECNCIANKIIRTNRLSEENTHLKA